ncbi:MAG: N-acetylmuramoyl-L-alanine amidase [Bdellovibrionales bacterium]|nr:N-acetylmuramoyl-L-alanine amidase [Bdellovibrionales bacterium]
MTFVSAEGDERVEGVINRLKSLRNTDASLTKSESWNSLKKQFDELQKSLPQGREKARLLFYRAVLFEELGRRGGDSLNLQLAAESFLNLSRSYPGVDLADEALYRAILLFEGDLRDPQKVVSLKEELSSRFPHSEYRFMFSSQVGGKGASHKIISRYSSGILPLVVLDPGHGGDDEGAVGIAGLREKDLVLSISRLIEKYLLESRCCRVVLTRERDEFMPLFERTAMANRLQASLFVSIHINAAEAAHDRVRGYEIFYVSSDANPEAVQLVKRENQLGVTQKAALGGFIQDLYRRGASRVSAPFAKAIFSSMKKEFPKVVDGISLQARGVAKAPFFVLFGAEMPAVLLELFFVTNSDDAYLLSQPSFRELTAEVIATSIANYVKQESVGER